MSRKDLSFNLTEAFNLVSHTSSLTFSILLVFTFWRDRESILNIVEKTRAEYKETWKKRKSQLVALIICFGSQLFISYANINSGYETIRVSYSIIEWQDLFISFDRVIVLTFVILSALLLTLTCYGLCVISMIGLSLSAVHKSFSKKLQNVTDSDKVTKLQLNLIVMFINIFISGELKLC